MFEVYKPSGGFGLSTIIYFLIGLVVTALLGGGTHLACESYRSFTLVLS